MALDTTQIERNLKSLRDQLPVSVTYNGETNNGWRSEVSVDRTRVDAGRVDQYSFSVGLIDSDWTTVPPLEAIVTVNGNNYRVLGKGNEATDTSTRLDLGSQYAQS